MLIFTVSWVIKFINLLDRDGLKQHAGSHTLHFILDLYIRLYKIKGFRDYQEININDYKEDLCLLK